MKRTNIILLAVLAALTVTSVLYAGIVNSRHDLSSTSTVWSGLGLTGEPCEFCHTPHGASGTQPLWNHEQSGAANFTMYTGYAMQHASPTANSYKADGDATLCLSCHDGTIAVADYGGWRSDAGGTGAESGGVMGSTTFSSSSFLVVDFNMTNDHPVGFLYEGSVSGDLELREPTDASVMAVLNANGNVDCGGCHDVHNGSGYVKFLNANPTGSGICLSCHLK
ncbi:MAG: hypothetical protein OEZ22_02090 [Spirochaetia bacterium]|nr:hypothetical protein [Spirochaetia bacterium]